jgi:hypothetical protein
MATNHITHSRPFSIEVTLPPLAVVVLKPRRQAAGGLALAA